MCGPQRRAPLKARPAHQPAQAPHAAAVEMDVPDLSGSRSVQTSVSGALWQGGWSVARAAVLGHADAVPMR